jgi:hypothetical protein
VPTGTRAAFFHTTTLGSGGYSSVAYDSGSGSWLRCVVAKTGAVAPSLVSSILGISCGGGGNSSLRDDGAHFGA